METELFLPILSQPRFDVPPYDFSPRVSAKFHHFSNNRVAANFPCYSSRNVNEDARNLYRFEVRVAQRRTNRWIDSLARGPVTPPASPSFFSFFPRENREPKKKRFPPNFPRIEEKFYCIFFLYSRSFVLRLIKLRYHEYGYNGWSNCEKLFKL